MKPQEQRAYEAYAKRLTEGTMRPLAPWEHLPERAQEAWRAAVVAAIDSPSKPETLTDKQVRLLNEAKTVEIAKMVKAALPPDRAFILLTASYGSGGTLAYVATMERDDAIRTMREWLQKQGALEDPSIRRIHRHRCPACGKLTRDTTAGCDHCGLEDK